MIYITGDCHAEFERFNTMNFPEQAEMTKDDYVIICGDFGGVWNKDNESAREKWWLDWLESKPFTTLFVDGNHENFDRLYGYPVEEWHRGNVHRIRPSVIHLMRGQVFQINGKRLFTFGGASSHDIDGGILDATASDYNFKKKQLKEFGLSYRVNHLSWWSEELPSDEEMQEGLRNLAANDNKVDFIVTHCCATSTQRDIDADLFSSDKLTDYLEGIKRNVDYTKWFFGHYHDNKNVSDKEILLYEQLIRMV